MFHPMKILLLTLETCRSTTAFGQRQPPLTTADDTTTIEDWHTVVSTAEDVNLIIQERGEKQSESGAPTLWLAGVCFFGSAKV